METNIHQNGITQGVIWKQLLLFFFPILFGTFFQQLYNTADAVIVGSMAGKQALAAVGGSTATIINLLVGFFVGLSSGATVVISQYYGAKDERGVQGTMHTGLMSMFYCGIIITILGIVAAPWIVRAIGTPPQVEELSVLYLRIFFLGSIPLVIYNMGAAIFRAMGDSRTPFYFLLISCLTNIVLDILFVGGFGMNVEGAAIATVLGQAVAALMAVFFNLKFNKEITFGAQYIKPHKETIKAIYIVGIPSIIMQSIASVMNFGMNKILLQFSSTAAAAFGIYFKLQSFVFMPVFGRYVRRGHNAGRHTYI